MTRTLSAIVLSASFAMAASAQTPSPAAKPTTGDFSGSLQEEGGSRSSDVKLNIKHITADGRVTARVQGAHPNKACGASLPASGIVQKDGSMRLEVDAGAPEGCERIYMIKSASGGSVSGTFIDATRTGGKLIPRKPSK
jgi:hypothetical protein